MQLPARAKRAAFFLPFQRVLTRLYSSGQPSSRD